jgi:TrmH family RNA methyltransferase
MPITIESAQNPKLKELKRLATRRERRRSGRFLVEGEDLVAAARAAGREAVEGFRVAGSELGDARFHDVEPGLLRSVSTLGSGARVIGVYEQVWSRPAGPLCLYLHGVGDPGNVGTVLRSAQAFGASCVALGPGCADPYSPRAVRASMGSVFARPPARAALAEVGGFKLALEGGAGELLADVELGAPLVLCLGAERDGLPAAVAAAADAAARIPMRPDAPDSLNVASAAAVGLYEVANRMADRA